MNSLNCPWCGKSNSLMMINLEDGYHTIECDSCEKPIEYEVEVTISDVSRGAVSEEEE